MSTEPLFIRVDGDATIGLGHAMRCLALAQAALDRQPVTVVTASLAPEVEARYLAAGVDVVTLAVTPGSPADAAATAALVSRGNGACLVVDGYALRGAYLDKLSRAVRLLVLDDVGTVDAAAGARVLNQNAHARPSLYPGLPDERLLLGLRYALLRREVRRPAGHQPRLARAGDDPRFHLLLSFGGSDPLQLTTRLSPWLRPSARGGRLTVLVGAANPARATLVDACGSDVQVLVDHRRMGDLLAEVDLAVTAGGSFCWELAHWGVPSVVVPIASHEAGVAASVAELGIGVNPGSGPTVAGEDVQAAVRELRQDLPRRQAMAEAGRTLVDGFGAERVLDALASLPPGGST